VAIARALAIRPALLLLDEPLSLVDANGRKELREVLRRLHLELGLTTLHVTHDREEALALSDHCAVLVDGALAQAGPTAEVFGRPASPAVARFLGVA
jgi:ABC-type sulfate/molybdate transport systems ATPase subunit